MADDHGVVDTPQAQNIINMPLADRVEDPGDKIPELDHHIESGSVSLLKGTRGTWPTCQIHYQHISKVPMAGSVRDPGDKIPKLDHHIESGSVSLLKGSGGTWPTYKEWLKPHIHKIQY